GGRGRPHRGRRTAPAPSRGPLARGARDRPPSCRTPAVRAITLPGRADGRPGTSPRPILEAMSDAAAAPVPPTLLARTVAVSPRALQGLLHLLPSPEPGDGMAWVRRGQGIVGWGQAA